MGGDGAGSVPAGVISTEDETRARPAKGSTFFLPLPFEKTVSATASPVLRRGFVGQVLATPSFSVTDTRESLSACSVASCFLGAGIMILAGFGSSCFADCVIVNVSSSTFLLNSLGVKLLASSADAQSSHCSTHCSPCSSMN